MMYDRNLSLSYIFMTQLILLQIRTVGHALAQYKCARFCFVKIHLSVIKKNKPLSIAPLF